MHLFAYIDPGAGSLLLQAVLAAVLSIPFFFRNTLRAALHRFRQRSDVTSSGTAERDDG
jgi:hypothetical protein